MPVATGLDALLTLLAEDADVLGCAGEAGATRAIVAGGTSADRQLAVFAEAGSLGPVVDWIGAATVSGC